MPDYSSYIPDWLKQVLGQTGRYLWETPMVRGYRQIAQDYGTGYRYPLEGMEYNQPQQVKEQVEEPTKENGLPDMSPQQYSQRLENYLTALVQAGQITADEYVDKLIQGQDRAATEGIHDDLPYYREIVSYYTPPSKLASFRQEKLEEQQKAAMSDPDFLRNQWMANQEALSAQANQEFQNQVQRNWFSDMGKNKPEGIAASDAYARAIQDRVSALNRTMYLNKFLMNEYPEWFQKYMATKGGNAVPGAIGPYMQEPSEAATLPAAYTGGSAAVPRELNFASWLLGKTQADEGYPLEQAEAFKKRLQEETTAKQAPFYKDYPELYPQYREYVTTPGSEYKSFTDWATSNPLTKTMYESNLERRARPQYTRPPKWMVKA